MNKGMLNQSRKNISLSYLDAEHNKLPWNVLKYKRVHYLFSNCSNKYYDHLDRGFILCVDCENGVKLEVATGQVVIH